MRTMILILAACLMTLPAASAHITGDDAPCADDGKVHRHMYCYSIPGGVPVSSAVQLADFDYVLA